MVRCRWCLNARQGVFEGEYTCILGMDGAKNCHRFTSMAKWNERLGYLEEWRVLIAPKKEVESVMWMASGEYLLPVRPDCDSARWCGLLLPEMNGYPKDITGDEMPSERFYKKRGQADERRDCIHRVNDQADGVRAYDE